MAVEIVTAGRLLTTNILQETRVPLRKPGIHARKRTKQPPSRSQGWVYNSALSLSYHSALSCFTTGRWKTWRCASRRLQLIFRGAPVTGIFVPKTSRRPIWQGDSYLFCVRVLLEEQLETI